MVLEAHDISKAKHPLYSSLVNYKQRAFVAAFATCGGIRQASKISNVSYVQHYEWLAYDADYVEAFREAEMMAGDYLEEAAYRRAADGVERAVYYQGQIVGYETEYSDSLLKFLLRGAKPWRYHERVDVTSQGRSLNIIIDRIPEQLATPIDGEATVIDGGADD